MIDWLFRRVQAVSASFSKEVGCVKPTRICSPRCVGMSNGESNVHRPLRALVYAGRGAGTRSVLSAVETLQSSLRESILVDQITAEEILGGKWQQECLVLVMPGGADLPYCQALNGRGNQLIRAFVESGGAYLGLCAGAYYACSRIEFELGTPLEVQGSRELSFFPGVAQGGVYPGFKYMSEAGAVAAPIVCCELATSSALPGDAATHGSAAALDAAPSDSRLHSTQPAVTSPDYADTECSPSEQPCEQFYDYCNGGPKFTWEQGTESSSSTCQRLAQYRDFDGAAAAVVCSVGRGQAVLCGTHPELATQWLGSVDAPMQQQHQSCEQAQGTDKAASVKSRLKQTQAQRETFWIKLMTAAGLGQYLV